MRCMDKSSNRSLLTRQAILYFTFAILTIGLNLLVQYIHMNYISPWICSIIHWSLVQTYYCPLNGRVFFGSLLGVAVGYLVKFFLDKFIVFQERSTDLKQTSKEFIKYFLFALVTTLINIGGQYFFYAVFSVEYLIAGFISLGIGYIVKFVLDRTYVFPQMQVNNVDETEMAGESR